MDQYVVVLVMFRSLQRPRPSSRFRKKITQTRQIYTPVSYRPTEQ